MLRVSTYLDVSGIHGIGIFAGEDIPANTVIWEFNPHVDLQYSCDEWQKLKEGISPQSFAALERYSYKENNSYWLCLDNAQFMNHSEDQYNVVNDASCRMHARWDIRRGDELLCNYFQYSDCDDVHVRCLHRADNPPVQSEISPGRQPQGSKQ